MGFTGVLKLFHPTYRSYFNPNNNCFLGQPCSSLAPYEGILDPPQLQKGLQIETRTMLSHIQTKYIICQPFPPQYADSLFFISSSKKTAPIALKKWYTTVDGSEIVHHLRCIKPSK